MLAVVNWDQVGAVIAGVGLVVAAVSWITRATLGKTLSGLVRRLDGHDTDLATITAAATDTRISVARIEGYLARGNGGGNTLHSNPLADELAQKLPDVEYPEVPPTPPRIP